MNFMELFQKAISDELTAVAAYNKMAQSLYIGLDEQRVADHLIEHADEEHGHWKELQDFAQRHGFQKELNFSLIHKEIFDNAPTNGNITEALMYHQELETGAITDYQALALFGEENNSPEVYEFFNELMHDEMKHFDDFADWTGQSRSCGVPHDVEVSMNPNEEDDDDDDKKESKKD